MRKTRNNALAPLKLVPLALLTASLSTQAEQNKDLQLETTRIKVNEELPQILYILPWKDFEPGTSRRFKLRLHDFFAEVYEPQLPALPPAVVPQQVQPSS